MSNILACEKMPWHILAACERKTNIFENNISRQNVTLPFKFSLYICIATSCHEIDLKWLPTKPIPTCILSARVSVDQLCSDPLGSSLLVFSGGLSLPGPTPAAASVGGVGPSGRLRDAAGWPRGLPDRHYPTDLKIY